MVVGNYVWGRIMRAHKTETAREDLVVMRDDNHDLMIRSPAANLKFSWIETSAHSAERG